jgi:hypothetical protein
MKSLDVMPPVGIDYPLRTRQRTHWIHAFKRRFDPIDKRDKIVSEDKAARAVTKGGKSTAGA